MSNDLVFNFLGKYVIRFWHFIHSCPQGTTGLVHVINKCLLFVISRSPIVFILWPWGQEWIPRKSAYQDSSLFILLHVEKRELSTTILVCTLVLSFSCTYFYSIKWYIKTQLWMIKKSFKIFFLLNCGWVQGFASSLK